LCGRDIATNFGVVVGEVILVDSCAIILFAVIVIYFSKKKQRNRIFACCGVVHLQQRYCSK
jgi:hypothetical protein